MLNKKDMDNKKGKSTTLLPIRPSCPTTPLSKPYYLNTTLY